MLLSAALLAAPIGTTFAQTEPGNHGAHHPGSPAPATGTMAPAGSASDSSPVPSAPTQPMPSATGGMMQGMPMGSSATGTQAGVGCSGMMGCAGGGPRPFYATLMDMPALTPEARRLIEAEADRRTGWGAQIISSGQTRLHRGLSVRDPASVQQAATEVREGLLLLESGTAALRALEAGASPREFATTWFKDQLGIPGGKPSPMTMQGSLWGLSWYHLISMTFLVLFLLAALLIQYTRMRRINALVQRLSLPGGPIPGTGPTPAVVPNATASPVLAAALPIIAAKAPPSIPDPVAPSIAPGRPWTGKLRLAAVFPETPNVKTFRLMAPDGGPIPFIFQPGQFLTFSVEVERRRVSRAYTIASAPTQRDHVEITVKREEQGTESRYLHDRAKVGDLIDVSGPAGAFTFAGRESDSIVLIAGGVGITPMMSVIRYLTDRAWPGEMHFLYGARTTLDFIFRDELEYLQRRHANLHVAATMSRAEGTAWLGSEGPVSKEFIARSVPDITKHRVHLCGPPAMMEAVKTALAELGVPKEQVRLEAFGPAQGRVPPATPAPANSPLSGPSIATSIATTTIEFTRSGKTGPLTPDQTVLEAAEAIGVQIDYSCRVGTCGTCIVPLKTGAVTMGIEDGLPPEQKARGMILACQAKSIGNLVVEA